MFDAYAEVFAQFPWFLPVVVTVFGTMIGSFLNVCIYRIPAGKSVVRPGSHCACGKPIAWYDNIPVLSWLILRGRARCCGGKFSVRYPAVELLTGLLFLACWLLLPPARAAGGMVLMSALVAATFIDLDHMIIPDVFSIGLGVVGVLLSFLMPAMQGECSGIFVVDSLRAVVTSLLGLLVGSGLVLWIALVAEAVLKKEAMGFGDVKLVGAIGAFTGWQGTVTAIFGGAVVGCVWFIVAMIWQKAAGKNAPELLKAETAEGEKTEVGLGAQVPYGPMLAIAGAAHFLWLHKPVAAYFAQIQELLVR